MMKRYRLQFLLTVVGLFIAIVACQKSQKIVLLDLGKKEIISEYTRTRYTVQPISFSPSKKTLTIHISIESTQTPEIISKNPKDVFLLTGPHYQAIIPSKWKSENSTKYVKSGQLIFPVDALFSPLHITLFGTEEIEFEWQVPASLIGTPNSQADTE